MTTDSTKTSKILAAPAPAPQQDSSVSTKPEYPSMIENTKRTVFDGKQVTTVKRYQRGQLLGKGGFAKCFFVTDIDTKEDWACKIVSKKSLTEQRHVQKLQMEIKIHRSIRHKYVCRFEDVFEDLENVYIIMELCHNQTLLHELMRKKRLSESETRRYMLQTLDAVRHIHKHNIVHRDLKLPNLFLDKASVIKIGDFGLACETHGGEGKKQGDSFCDLGGTPNYIAPEVLDGKSGVSFEVDVWALGVVLYTCLVGKPPFETSDIKSTYKRIRANRCAVSVSACAIRTIPPARAT